MKLQQPQVKSKSENTQTESVSQLPQNATFQLSERTFGQKLADKLATKVGSWGFLIGQTTVLTAWVGCNLAPGMPHWDESPFILLNLVFSFASAYTAPVVLMSQNRQSDEDRAHAMQNHQVNLQTAENLELLHQKMDAVYTQKLAELSELIQKQTAQNEAQKSEAEAQSTEAQSHIATLTAPLPKYSYIGLLPSNVQPQQSYLLPMVDDNLFAQAVAKPEASVTHSSSEQN